MEVKKLIPKIGRYLDEVALHDWQQFVDDDGTVEIDANAILYEALQHVCDEEEIADIDMLVDYLEPLAAVKALVRDMESLVRELAEDAREWREAQSKGIPGIMNYYGMSIKDFL